MPTLGTFRIEGERERQRDLLLQEVNRERPVVNTGFDSPAQFRDHLVSVANLTHEQRQANASALHDTCLQLEGVRP